MFWGVGFLLSILFNFAPFPYNSLVIAIKIIVFKTFLAAMMGMRNQTRMLILRIEAIWVIR